MRCAKATRQWLVPRSLSQTAWFRCQLLALGPRAPSSAGGHRTGGLNGLNRPGHALSGLSPTHDRWLITSELAGAYQGGPVAVLVVSRPSWS